MFSGGGGGGDGGGEATASRTHILVCGPPGFTAAVAGVKVHRDTGAPVDDDGYVEDDEDVVFTGGFLEEVGHARRDIHRFGDA